jgi:TRAP-type C4-dicarboxylate transport system substrate-binding protein
MRAGLLLTLLTSAAHADPTLIRLGSVVPDGTVWARELRAMGRDVESATNHAVKLKWYLGGIAGDELQVGERISRDQLDGGISGGMLCEKLAPSMRVFRIPGLFQTRAEVSYVVSRLKPQLDKEMLQAGFANLVESAVGPSIPFMRVAARDLSELRKQRFWIWDVDEPLKAILPAMGITVVPLPIDQAARAFDANQHDGFITPPTAALGFQWSTQVRWFTDFQFGWVVGCMIMANRTFDRLPVEVRDALRAAGAKTRARMEDTAGEMDAQLTGALFEKQGLKHLRSSEAARTELFEAARVAREKTRVVGSELLGQVIAWLADYRAQAPR